MRRILPAAAFVLAAHLARAEDAPLPDPQALKKRLIASAEKLNKDRENYSCTVRLETNEMDGAGGLKKKKLLVQERFFVNGWTVDHLLERDGKTLTGDDARKERERVDKLVKKYSRESRFDKEQERWERQMDVFIRAVRFSNGRRELRNGRATIVYDMLGDPKFRPRKLEERFAQALSGRIWVDEELGVPQEVKLRTERDLKIAGGLAANLYKGFQLHLVQQRQADGVWLTKTAEGSGDARALFMRQRFRFHEEVDQCRLFSVDTQQKVQAPK